MTSAAERSPYWAGPGDPVLHCLKGEKERSSRKWLRQDTKGLAVYSIE